MGKLSDLVKHDYDEEVEIIRDAGGNVWLVGLAVAFLFALMWGIDVVFRNEPWTGRDVDFAIIGVVFLPLVNRAWERHKVTAQMKHLREIRVEMKLNALLGFVNIKDGDDDE